MGRPRPGRDFRIWGFHALITHGPQRAARVRARGRVL